MKKKVLTILICGLTILGLTGCSTNKNELDGGKESHIEIGKESNVEIVETEVSLSIKENTLTNTGVTLVLKNDSDAKIQYGNPYEIEIEKDGKWHKLNVELSFTLAASYLESGESKEIELNWEHGYGKLEPGDYRIIKSINIEKEDEVYEGFYVAAEFTIE